MVNAKEKNNRSSNNTGNDSKPFDPSKTDSARIIKQYSSDLAGQISGGSQNLFPSQKRSSKDRSDKSSNNLGHPGDIKKTYTR